MHATAASPPSIRIRAMSQRKRRCVPPPTAPPCRRSDRYRPRRPAPSVRAAVSRSPAGSSPRSSPPPNEPERGDDPSQPAPARKSPSAPTPAGTCSPIRPRAPAASR
ncbi:hypothetical protein MMEU_5262 [Mycobacterium marinum str. Europe]|nr:hypothetical protein MMEU_5262 [Mycobacterium marinum str. Europe]